MWKMWKKIFLFSTFILCASGCSPLPEADQYSDHVFTMQAYTGNEEDTNNEMMERATNFCQSREKKVEVVDSNIRYQGLDKKQKNLLHEANKTFQDKNTGHTDCDYEITFKFRCI
jgi:hypothetical protein